MFRNNLYLLLFLLIFTFNPTYAQTNVACIGNSITFGSKLADRPTQCYPYQLDVLLGNNYNVINYGEASRTALNVDGSSYILSSQWKYSTAIPHDIIIILLGTNDSSDDYWAEYANFKDDYLYIMNSYKNYGDPIFILGLPPPIYNESHWAHDATLINTIIPMIKELASETNATIADFNGALLGKPELFIDGVHPNEIGAGIMAEVAYSAIQKALSSSDPPPNTPTGLKTISGDFNINLEWHVNTEDDLFLYQIFRSFEKGGVPAYIGYALKPNTTYSDNNIQTDHIYYYSINAMDIHQNVSSRTAAVAGQTIDDTPPSAPINLNAILEADSVKLTWTPNTEYDINKYYVFRNTNINDIQLPSSIVGTVHAPKSDFIDLSFDSETNYYYGIKAVDIYGNHGEISNIVNITTKSRPVSADTSLTFFEDMPHEFTVTDFPFIDADNDLLNKIIFINSTQNKYFTYDSDSIGNIITCEDISKLVFTPDSNEYGESYTSFTYKVVDSSGSASIDTNMVLIDIASVNDHPAINAISDIYIMEDSHNILLPISGINAGPSNELQNLSVKAFADNPSFVTVPNIQYNSPNEEGLITLDPVENILGIIPMTVQIIDDGGTSYGGIDTFSTTFDIHISPINDPPVFNFLDNILIPEDSETIIELTGIQAGPWETNQRIDISVHSNDTDMLPHPQLSYTSPDTTATLIFTTILNVFGTSSITIIMSDDGGTEFGGNDSTSYIIPVEILPVNDPPSDFNIITPTNDLTFVINKLNYLNIFSISWEEPNDIENDDILYDIIFSSDFSGISRYGLNSTNTEFSFKEILAATDTISITNGAFSIIASDGDLQTNAINSGIQIKVDGRSFAPAKLNLDQNHPNPFNHGTLIGFDLPKRTEVTLTVFNLLGEEIIRLIDNKIHERGYNTISWNGLDKYQNHIPSGAYIIQIKSDSEVKHKKLLLLK